MDWLRFSGCAFSGCAFACCAFTGCAFASCAFASYTCAYIALMFVGSSFLVFNVMIVDDVPTLVGNPKSNFLRLLKSRALNFQL